MCRIKDEIKKKEEKKFKKREGEKMKKKKTQPSPRHAGSEI